MEHLEPAFGRELVFFVIFLLIAFLLENTLSLILNIIAKMVHCLYIVGFGSNVSRFQTLHIFTQFLKNAISKKFSKSNVDLPNVGSITGKLFFLIVTTYALILQKASAP